MRLYGFTVVRNEADVVAESVAHNLARLDAIAVTDNGSDDGTWETLQGLASRDARIHLFRDLAPFNHRVFHRSAMMVRRIGWRRRRGDWVVQCDCDELHESDVRAVCEASAGHDLILGRKWMFTLLPDTPTDGPVRERVRWHHPEPHVELRAYRNPRWFFVRAVEVRYGLSISPVRLDIAHYQYRSPGQVDSRLAVRHKAAETHDLDWWRRSPLGIASSTRNLVRRDALDGWEPWRGDA